MTTVFYEPEIRQGDVGRYVAFSREGRPGIWAGINECGVAFVAADAYTEQCHKVSNDQISDLFCAYEKILANAETAGEGVAALSDYYLNKFPAPDIAQWSDVKESRLTEFLPPNHLHTKTLRRGFSVATNHFHALPGAVTEQNNPGTYLRLRRAKTLLNLTPSKAGILSLLRDQERGASEQSLCRIAQKEGEFFTQASVMFSVGASGISVQYLINGNPMNKKYSTMHFRGVGF